MHQHVVIVGNGISGITAARYIRKASDHAITVISSETEHFYSRTALMYIYMGHMKYEHTKPYEDFFWQKNNIELVKDHVDTLDVNNKKIFLQSGNSIQFDTLIIATGSVSNKPNIPGIDLNGVQALYGMPDLEQMFENTKSIKHAVVAGGGLIGIEMAEMLLSRNIIVTFLVRENYYWNNVLPEEESKMVSAHIRSHHVDLRTATEIKEIKGDTSGRVSSIITNSNEEISCEFLGIAIGVSPNISFLQNSDVETDRGVLVNEYFETNIPGIFAIGDCVQHRQPPAGRKRIEQVWYTGKIHGEIVAANICDTRTIYNPGPWYNSAKFFDIEYQTYGNVEPNAKVEEKSFYWQHTNGKKCFRAVYNKSDGAITGFNALGLRLRHEVCDKWLKEKKHIDDVMADLNRLNFDPEFSHNYGYEMLRAYNLETGKKVRKIKRNSFSFWGR